jgi:hypothetical protein
MNPANTPPSNHDAFDMQAFLSAVVDELPAAADRVTVYRRAVASEETPEQDLNDSVLIVPASEAEAEVVAQARTVIFDRPDVWRAICPGLEIGTTDISALTIGIAAGLVPMIIAGRITFPLVPGAIAILGIIVTRIGIATICADHKQSN